MTELLREALSPHQLPATILLGFVILYWLLVVVGFLDCDTELPDAGHADVGDSGSALGAAWVTAGRWLGFSKVPIVIWASFFILFFWAAFLILNAMLNGQPGERGFVASLILYLPATFISLLLTKLVTWPLAKLYKVISNAPSESVEVIGATGVVTTSKVDYEFGQLEIANEGAPVRIQVYVARGHSHLKKGDLAVVVKRAADGMRYQIKRASIPNNLC
jgi:hypothetical protein